MGGHNHFEGKGMSGDKNQYNIFCMIRGFEYFSFDNFFKKKTIFSKITFFCKYCLKRQPVAAHNIFSRRFYKMLVNISVKNIWRSGERSGYDEEIHSIFKIFFVIKKKIDSIFRKISQNFKVNFI